MALSEEQEAYRRRKRREEYLRNTGRPLLVKGMAWERARARVRSFHAQGMTYSQMSRITGIPQRTLVNLAMTSRKGMKRATYTALMAMQFEEPDPTAMVSPVATRRRMAALWRDGFPLPWIAERVGVGNRNYFQALLRGTKGVVAVTYATHRAVADLYEKLEGHWPEELGIEPRAARFVSAFARKKGFAPRMCWDPDTIGDPEALPDWTGYCGTGFGMIVHKRDGIPPCDRCVDAYDYRDPYPGFSGEKFRALRVRRGWARTPLGKEVGIDPSTIQYWEEGRSRPQRQGRLDRVLSVLDATYEDVCDM